MTRARAAILHHLLPLVPFDGWSDYALRQASMQAKVELATAFPGGVSECVDYFFSEADEALEKACPQSSLAALRVPERIETLILARLAHFLPHREALRRAISQRALPWNAPAACKSLYRSVDLMWRLAGDHATNFSFYTKRMTLAGLYTGTLLYWLNDNSEGHEATHAFLKRRLSDIGAFGKWKKKCGESLARLHV